MVRVIAETFTGTPATSKRKTRQASGKRKKQALDAHPSGGATARSPGERSQTLDVHPSGRPKRGASKSLDPSMLDNSESDADDADPAYDPLDSYSDASE